MHLQYSWFGLWFFLFEYCFFPAWVLLCLLKWFDVVYDESHMLQWCFFPVYVAACSFNLLIDTKAFSHWSHLYGLSPVWALLMWTCRLLMWLLEYGQEEHLFGASSEWVILCVFKLLDIVEEYSQRSHLYGLSPEWILVCLFISLEVIDE